MASTQDAIAAEEAPLRRQRNKRLRQAVHRHKAVTRQGIQERLFTLAFSGLVYPQIWEDPVVDLEALRLKEGERLVAIASGGCNVLSYLAAAPISRHRHRPQSGARRAQQAEARGARAPAGLRRLPHLLRRRQPAAEHRRLLRTTCARISMRPRASTGNRATASAAGASATSAPTSIATACSATSSAPGISWRARTATNPRRLLAARTRERAAPHLRERARAAVPQAPHPLAARQAVGAVRSRHSALAVHRAEGRSSRAWPTCCSRACSASPATST